MAYNPILNTEIQSGSPLDQALLSKIKENFEFQQTELAAKQALIDDLNARTARYIVKKYSSGTNWYEIYNDGWIRQRVQTGALTSYNGTANLLVTMRDTSYTALCVPEAASEDTYVFNVQTKGTTSVGIRNRGNVGNIPVVVEGYASSSALASLGVIVSY